MLHGLVRALGLQSPKTPSASTSLATATLLAAAALDKPSHLMMASSRFPTVHADQKNNVLYHLTNKDIFNMNDLCSLNEDLLYG